MPCPQCNRSMQIKDRPHEYKNYVIYTWYCSHCKRTITTREDK